MTISSVPWRIPVREAYFQESRVALRMKHPYEEQARVYRKDATQERKICDVEIEIVTFVIDGNVKLTIPPDRQKKIKVRSRSVALCRVFDLEFNGIHLTQVILKLWVVNGQNVIDVPVCEIEPRRQLFFPVESKNCINSVS